ncbi:DNA-(apurinic or apyrimidinic site) lyase 2-like isoform X1 [Leptotrombidium deliense]|uniref:DNA-(apurinic or apyrimidinic site) endonuclease n=1 Tax=Leptotrombidium deliense TaxID=299467 RepID=A0A443SFW1_9ACAR|nr:DNA-(apurinic or apyrimidinic site) lyase 2-like isoform X1 [Leptotrombidium deliense]
MKIITWNLNGLRSLKDSLHRVIDDLKADVYCFQETKLSRNQVEEEIAFIPDYCSFFAFPKFKSGYSGVATYCRESVRPFDAQDSMVNRNKRLLTSYVFTDAQQKTLDSEGRILITKHCLDTDDADGPSTVNLFVVNVYCPCGNTDNPERFSFKLDFYNLLETKLLDLIECDESENHILLVGDINTAHKRVDHCEPDDDFDENAGRLWLDNLFNATNNISFVDIYRHFHPDTTNAYTCWSTKVNARETNYGTRIDYCICDSGFINYIDECCLLTEVRGSDHCPVLVTLKNVKVRKSEKYPKLCTKLWPEFGCGKRQMKMTDFVFKRVKCEINESNSEQEGTPKKRKDNSMTNSVCQVSKVEQRAFQTEDKNVNFTNEQRKTETEQSNFALQWKSVLKGPSKPPLCKGHGIPSVLRTVTKSGPNRGKQFFACSLPVGNRDNPKSQCDFFQWVNK